MPRPCAGRFVGVWHRASGGPCTVVVIDETGLLKRRHAGGSPTIEWAGRPREHCQIGVFLASASACGPALLDRELSLPKEGAGS